MRKPGFTLLRRAGHGAGEADELQLRATLHVATRLARELMGALMKS